MFEPISEVLNEELYVGSQEGLQQLAEYKITHVVSVINFPIFKNLGGRKHLWIPLADLETENLITHLPEAISFISEALGTPIPEFVEDGNDGFIDYNAAKPLACALDMLDLENKGSGRSNGNRVFVHCAAGMSRSVSIVAAYLMKSRQLTFGHALQLISNRRPIADPNEGFRSQLTLFQEMRMNLDVEHPVYRCVLLRMMGERAFDIGGGFRDTAAFAKAPATAAEVAAAGSKGRTVFRCRKCRHLLATSANEMPTDAAMGHKIFRDRWKAAPHLRKPNELSADAAVETSIFVEPMMWMTAAAQGQTQGKLHCPTCTARLGSFNWAGITNTSGNWVTPAFQIHMSKVDSILPPVMDGGSHSNSYNGAVEVLMKEGRSIEDGSGNSNNSSSNSSGNSNTSSNSNNDSNSHPIRAIVMPRALLSSSSASSSRPFVTPPLRNSKPVDSSPPSSISNTMANAPLTASQPRPLGESMERCEAEMSYNVLLSPTPQPTEDEFSAFHIALAASAAAVVSSHMTAVGDKTSIGSLKEDGIMEKEGKEEGKEEGKGACVSMKTFTSITNAHPNHHHDEKGHNAQDPSFEVQNLRIHNSENDDDDMYGEKYLTEFRDLINDVATSVSHHTTSISHSNNNISNDDIDSPSPSMFSSALGSQVGDDNDNDNGGLMDSAASIIIPPSLNAIEEGLFSNSTGGVDKSIVSTSMGLKGDDRGIVGPPIPPLLASSTTNLSPEAPPSSSSISTPSSTSTSSSTLTSSSISTPSSSSSSSSTFSFSTLPQAAPQAPPHTTQQWFTHLIVECDGILVDSERVNCESLRQAILEVTGYDIPHQYPMDFSDVLGMDDYGCVQYYAQQRRQRRKDQLMMMMKMASCHGGRGQASGSDGGGGSSGAREEEVEEKGTSVENCNVDSSSSSSPPSPSPSPSPPSPSLPSPSPPILFPDESDPRAIMWDGGDLEALAAAVMLARERWIRDLTAPPHPPLRACDGAISLLRRAKDTNVQTVIVSSGSLERMTRNLVQSQLLPLLPPSTLLLSALDVPAGKPDPDIFLEAMRRAKCSDPWRALVVEDSVVGLRAARVAGTRALGVTHVLPASKLLAHADSVVTSLRDVTLGQHMSLELELEIELTREVEAHIRKQKLKVLQQLMQQQQQKRKRIRELELELLKRQQQGGGGVGNRK